MLKSYSDLYLKKTIFSANEKKFKALLWEKFKLTVIESCYFDGNEQDSLRLWFDFSHTCSSPACQKLGDIAKNHPMRSCLDFYSDEIKELGTQITEAYISCFDKQTDKEAIVYVNDFSLSLKAYAYGHASVKMRDDVCKRFGLPRKHVFVFYEPRLTIICENEEQYNHITENQDKIRKLCFKRLKRHDKYKIIANSDNVDLNILLKSKIESSLLNDYYRESLFSK